MCVSVCLSVAACPHHCTDPDVTWGNGRGCPLVVHYRRICNRCIDFVAITTQHEREMSATACNHSMPVDYCDLQELTSSTYQLIYHKRLYIQYLFGRPFVKRFAPCYRTVVCPVCLYVTLVHCGQTLGWIKMPLRMEIGLGPGHTVLVEDPVPPHGKGHKSPHFSADVSCGKTVAHLNNC